jgi:integrase
VDEHTTEDTMATIRERHWQSASGEDRTAWIADFFDAQGTRRQKTFRLKKDADAWLVQARHQVAAGTFTPESTSVTIKEAIDLWLQRAGAEGLEHGTQVQYAQHAAHLLKLIAGDLKLAKLTQARVEQLRDDLLRAHNRPMAKKILASFKGVLREAKRRNLVAQNVAAETTIGANGRHTKRLKVGVDLPTTDEFKAMLDAARDARERSMLCLAGIAGLRASEFRGLPWTDLNFGAEPSVTVTQRADAWGTVGSPKSESAHRTIELGSVTVRALKEWRLAQPSGRTLVFGTVSDRPDMLGNLQDRVLDKVQVRAGVVDRDGKAKYAWHALRHFAITSWIVGGRHDLKTVQHLAGHATLAMTIDRYGHFVPSKDAHARASEHEAALLG